MLFARICQIHIIYVIIYVMLNVGHPIKINNGIDNLAYQAFRKCEQILKLN